MSDNDSGDGGTMVCPNGHSWTWDDYFSPWCPECGGERVRPDTPDVEHQVAQASGAVFEGGAPDGL